jgi:hypothetical protein
MSLYPVAFLFDYFEFKEKIAPALDALVNGNSRELEQLAINLVKENPKIWEFIAYSRVPLYDHDIEKSVEDVIGAGVLAWLLLVISNYCSRIDHRVDYGILIESGVNEETVEILWNGKPLAGLLININPKIVPANYVDTTNDEREFSVNDCHVGWLDFDEIEKMKTTIQANMKLNKTSAHDNLLTMLDEAIVSKKTLILGFWFN